MHFCLVISFFLFKINLQVTSVSISLHFKTKTLKNRTVLEDIREKTLEQGK